MKRQSVLGFDVLLGSDGRIAVPPEVVTALGHEAASLLHVQLTPASVSEELRARGVTDDELNAIAQLQMEPRERVIAFLLAEGALAHRHSRGRRKKAART
jgi:hypothetical protein